MRLQSSTTPYCLANKTPSRKKRFFFFQPFFFFCRCILKCVGCTRVTLLNCLLDRFALRHSLKRKHNYFMCLNFWLHESLLLCNNIWIWASQHRWLLGLSNIWKWIIMIKHGSKLSNGRSFADVFFLIERLHCRQILIIAIIIVTNMKKLWLFLLQHKAWAAKSMDLSLTVWCQWSKSFQFFPSQADMTLMLSIKTFGQRQWKPQLSTRTC